MQIAAYDHAIDILNMVVTYMERTGMASLYNRMAIKRERRMQIKREKDEDLMGIKRERRMKI
jgi:hypothetical protein